MRRGQGRGTAGYDNVQMAVARKPQRIMATAGSHDTGGRDWRSPMALPTTAVLGCSCEAGAAGGYDHGEEGKTCLAAGITPYVARPSPSANQQRGLFSKDEFTSDGATATSQGPAGARLTVRCATVALGRPIRSYATAACRACPLKQQCTRNKGGRRLPGGERTPVGSDGAAGRSRPEGRKQRKP